GLVVSRILLSIPPELSDPLSAVGLALGFDEQLASTRARAKKADSPMELRALRLRIEHLRDLLLPKPKRIRQRFIFLSSFFRCTASGQHRTSTISCYCREEGFSNRLLKVETSLLLQAGNASRMTAFEYCRRQ